MTWQLDQHDTATTDPVESVIVPSIKDLGDFSVRRALPAKERQMVGPFIFFDHFGPTVFQPGQAVDVRPHPHIGISTITWLFDGEIRHKDSLGYDQVIRPGEVNWMTSGSGIVHSERTPEQARGGGSPLFGLQTWVALPKAREEVDPAFYHYGAQAIPCFDDEDVKVRLITGEGWGQASPVKTESFTFYAEVNLGQGRRFGIPTHLEESALYLCQGELEVAGQHYQAGTLVLLKPGSLASVKAVKDCKFMIFGGDAMDGPRHLYWNFVSSSKERIEQAKEDWRQKKFPMVAGDHEFIPLPEDQ